MANTNFGINVNVNFTGVSYNAATQQWTGQPNWTVVPSLQGVPPVKLNVNTNTITWNLHAAVPNGYSAAFPSTGAILFSASPTWTGGVPTTQNASTVLAGDNFNGLTANEVFEYTIVVTLSTTAGGVQVSQNFTYDPDVENEAGTATIALVRTRT